MLRDCGYNLLLLLFDSLLHPTKRRNIFKGEGASCKSQQGRMPTFWPPCGAFWWALWSTLRPVKCHRWKKQTETASAMMGRCRLMLCGCWAVQKVAPGFLPCVFLQKREANDLPRSSAVKPWRCEIRWLHVSIETLTLKSSIVLLQCSVLERGEKGCSLNLETHQILFQTKRTTSCLWCVFNPQQLSTNFHPEVTSAEEGEIRASRPMKWCVSCTVYSIWHRDSCHIVRFLAVQSSNWIAWMIS